MSETLTIRGHHLLCMHGFRGLGYSEEFVRNMSRVVEAFFGGQETQVRLVVGWDEICASCPHAGDGRCEKNENGPEKVRSRDRAVLQRLGLEERQHYPSPELRRRVAHRIEPAHLESLCAPCRWLELGCCSAGLKAGGPPAVPRQPSPESD